MEFIALNCQQASKRVRMFVCLFDGGYRHFQQYFSFIGRGNRSTRENHRTATNHCQTLSHNVVSSTPRLSGIRTHNVSGDRH